LAFNAARDWLKSQNIEMRVIDKDDSTRVLGTIHLIKDGTDQGKYVETTLGTYDKPGLFFPIPPDPFYFASWTAENSSGQTVVADVIAPVRTWLHQQGLNFELR